MKDSILDKFISYISPQKGFQRTHAKVRSELMKVNIRKYDGAASGRRTKDWISATSTDVNSEIDSSAATIRARARDLVRNDPWAARAIQVFESSIVGKGIMTEFDLPTKRAEKIVNDDWKQWAYTTDCDWHGLMDFCAMQRACIRSVAESGECLARLHFLNDKSINTPLQIELLEPDFINKTMLKNQSTKNLIVSGIEVDDRGRKVAYHLYKEHPGATNLFKSSIMDTVRVDAKYILHIYRIDRPGALRGISWLAPVLLHMREMNKYFDAQIVKQQISACLTGFITDNEGASGLKAADISILEKYEPATIQILGPGQDFKESNPPRVDGYNEFINTSLHAIASGLGISFESLTGDLSQVNFSSAKMGRMEMEKNIDAWRNQMFYPMFLNPIARAFLLAEELKGVNVQGAVFKQTAPRREMIQPDKEVPALINAVRGGLMSLREAIRQSGNDPEKVFEEIEETNEELDEKGLIFDSDPRKTSKNGDTSSINIPTAENNDIDSDTETEE